MRFRNREAFYQAMLDKFPSGMLSRKDAIDHSPSCNGSWAWIVDEKNRVPGARGMYRIPSATLANQASVSPQAAPAATSPEATPAPLKTPQVQATRLRTDVIELLDGSFVPMYDPDYVAWGHYKDVEKILKSREFFTTYIVGESGNGKTKMVMQACASANREMFRINFNRYTDEDELLGSFRLKSGETAFEYGPVVNAMKRGAVLLLDEVDRGAPERMPCLYPVLEGGSVFLKKINELVSPKPGFCIMATANSKSRGETASNRYGAANVHEEAFLDRFNLTMEQPYPTEAIEKSIMAKKARSMGNYDETIISCLAKWATSIRATYMNGGDIQEVVSTRRLLDIIHINATFKEDWLKSVGRCIARFDQTHQEAFTKLLESLIPQPEPQVQTASDTTNNGDVQSDGIQKRNLII